GRGRCAVYQQSVFRRRRIQSGAKAAVLCRVQPACVLSDQQDVPGLRARRQRLRQSLCDVRDVLRYRRDSQFRQWRRAVYGSALSQSGAPARLLRRSEGHFLTAVAASQEAARRIVGQNRTEQKRGGAAENDNERNPGHLSMEGKANELGRMGEGVELAHIVEQGARFLDPPQRVER